MPPSDFDNVHLVPSIVTDAIADRIGPARAAETCAAILQGLDAAGWTFIRAEDLAALRDTEAQILARMRFLRDLVEAAAALAARRPRPAAPGESPVRLVVRDGENVVPLDDWLRGAAGETGPRTGGFR